MGFPFDVGRWMFDVGCSARRQDQMGGNAENLNIELRTFNVQRPIIGKTEY
jgi:hypothetical protein